MSTTACLLMLGGIFAVFVGGAWIVVASIDRERQRQDKANAHYDTLR